MMSSKWPLVREKCGVKCTFPTLAEWADDWTAEAKIEAIVQQNARETQRFKEKLKFSEGDQFGSRAVGGQKPLDEGHYSLIQSSDYLPPDTAEEEAYHRSFTPAMRTRRHMFVWLLYAFLAVVVAVVVLASEHACAVILNARVEATKKLLLQNDLPAAWLVWTGSSLALCILSCAMVLWQPAAASSGVPGLIGYLNGVMPLGRSPLTGKTTDFRSVQTLFAKLIGTCLSTPSGLAVGPEGPIIHISALLGHHMTQAWERVSHKILSKRFQFTVRKGEDRDFLAAGAACGICVAFQAPLAGCLFIVEEAASFYTTEHLDYTFFATMIAYLVALALATSTDDGFTKFKQTTGYFCTIFDQLDMLMFVAIASVGGLLGALFNLLVKHLNTLRVRHVNKSSFRRVAEVTLLALLTGTVTVFLPSLYRCEHPTRSLLMEDSIGCLSEEDAFQISHGSVSHAAFAELVGNTTLAQQRASAGLAAYRVSDDLQGDAWTDVVWIDNSGDDSQHVHLHYQHSYTCNETDYNGMSMLWLNGGVKGVKVLMQRGFPHMISCEVLLVFFVAYFILAAYTSGVSVPAGLVIPMLLLGGSFGRAGGLLGIGLKKQLCDSLSGLTEDVTDTYYWSTVYRWIGRDCRLPDPGMYAVVGMASFLGGSTRITMMLATMIVELTDDASLMAPVGVASIISMIVGNLFNHGLYHGLLPVFNIPFVNSEPADVMWLVGVMDVMRKDVVALSKSTQPYDIEELIEKCDSGEVTHNAFPVVDCSRKQRRLRGIISLENLRRAAATPELHRASRRSVGNPQGKVNLLDYADRSPITIVPHAKAARGKRPTCPSISPKPSAKSRVVRSLRHVSQDGHAGTHQLSFSPASRFSPAHLLFRLCLTLGCLRPAPLRLRQRRDAGGDHHPQGPHDLRDRREDQAAQGGGYATRLGAPLEDPAADKGAGETARGERGAEGGGLAGGGPGQQPAGHPPQRSRQELTNSQPC